MVYDQKKSHILGTIKADKDHIKRARGLQYHTPMLTNRDKPKSEEGGSKSYIFVLGGTTAKILKEAHHTGYLSPLAPSYTNSYTKQQTRLSPKQTSRGGGWIGIGVWYCNPRALLAEGVGCHEKVTEKQRERESNCHAQPRLPP